MKAHETGWASTVFEQTKQAGLLAGLWLAGQTLVFAGGKPAEFGAPKLTGTFHPYERRDTNIITSVVMKPAPKCGECHAFATVNQNTQVPRLELFVIHGNKTNSWTIAGELKGKAVVFAKDKLHLSYSEGLLKGTFEGDMKARIELKAEGN